MLIACVVLRVMTIQQALNGQKVVIVRCEELNVSGSFFRMKVGVLYSALCKGIVC